ncbi:DUF4250 domain-containing protein [Clostridium sp.]|uniref:DUF4250 domain-containing protein n=1 Tax=Clostridium sp. TaxID=1506 RepID=UPI00262CEE8A|nr:DUF4250 domain-containing protein [Clostridium sp.]
MDKDSLLQMDSNILLSIINMKLRDFYSNLESLCRDIDIKEEELKEKLSLIGYEYNKKQNQFK